MSGFAPREPDLPRMVRERRARLAAAMARHDLPALLLLGRASVQYATGVVWPASDAGHAFLQPTIALVTADDPLPHVFTPPLASAPTGDEATLSADRVHPPLHPDCPSGVAELVARLRAVLGERVPERLGIDEPTVAMHLELRDLLPGVEVVDAQPVLAAARLVKTPDEVACLRRAQEINDRAMLDVHATLRPGVRPLDLSALFLARVAELGASGNLVDPIWQPMPASRSAGPFAVNGEVVFPLPSDARPLAAGDTLWIDTGITWNGYVSDFGRTWIVGREPSAAERALFARWREVLARVLDRVRPGATGADLTAAACAGEARPPWLAHLYLAHGAGLDSAEAPLIGTDLGPSFDASVVLAPGMVLVFEPVVWEEGVGGHRAEESVVVTDTGWESLTRHGFAPFA